MNKENTRSSGRACRSRNFESYYMSHPERPRAPRRRHLPAQQKEVAELRKQLAGLQDTSELAGGALQGARETETGTILATLVKSNVKVNTSSDSRLTSPHRRLLFSPTHAASIFSLANGTLLMKVCIGVLP